MQEIGVWTTEEGTVTASLQLESEITEDVSAEELPKWVGGALTGALGGATVGAAAGPWGALIGAAAGATLGGAAAAAEPPPPPPPKPPRASAPAARPPAPAASASASAGARADTALVLQQLAAALPALIQLAASTAPASTAPASTAPPSTAPAAGPKESDVWSGDGTSEVAPMDESLELEEWTLASETEGAWTIS
jgi:hypothetical protein